MLKFTHQSIISLNIRNYIQFLFFMKLNKALTLASNSPRRKEILSLAGFSFDIKVIPTDELFPQEMPAELVPIYLAEAKAACFSAIIQDEIILCADTVVIISDDLGNKSLLNKPQDAEDAIKMLKSLSNQTHQVVTGVCLLTKEEKISFSDTSWVSFKQLTDWEIEHYIAHYQPFDKAGSYGVQDFIGMIGIQKIEGSFYTIMGLPIHKVYENLQKYIIHD